MKELGLNDIISFGKYEGDSYRNVLEKDWRYLILLRQNNIIEFKEEINKELDPVEEFINAMKKHDILKKEVDTKFSIFNLFKK